MFLKIIERPIEKADTLFGSNTLMSSTGRRDRLSYAAINAVISLCWAPFTITLAFFLACLFWELAIRPLLNILLTTVLLGRSTPTRIVFLASLVFANTLFSSIQMYALFSGHPLGAVIVLLTASANLMLAVAYMSRDKPTFIASMAPLGIVSILLPFILHTDLAGKIALLALETMGAIGLAAALQRHAMLTRQTAEESKARAKAEEQNAVKSQFLSTMTHELRTPLNAIIGYTEMMTETAQEDGRAADVADHDRVIRAAHSLLALINDILDISKIEAGKMTMNAEPFSVAALVAEAAATATPLTRLNHNRFDVAAAPDLGEADTDSFRLNQCLLNLLSNAAKFTKDSGIMFSARREFSEMGDWLVFDVADGGIGISKEQLSRLFTPFVQADSKITRAYGGTGLGLAITQQIAALLGGSISAQSIPGRGSKFTLRIPAKLNAGAAPDAASSSPKQGQPIALIIDDDEAMRDLATRQLSHVGFSVLTAANGAQGATLANMHQPNIVILDINLPDRSGWSVLGEMLGEERLEQTPILVVSIEDAREKAMALGACDVLMKPIAKAKLVSTVLRYARLGTSFASDEDLRAASEPAARAAS